ncbi:MAG: hypothetical protein COV99_10075 [Bacteroidetes bacterium CG12_big_fil_rev_8_21_14_0_65_60_17]|nr:MAG: hypothetical protein COV99_10075 [Bacteroidetes bacterium CG12_big_fil_rev_8_21_14_0_65_60_17]
MASSSQGIQTALQAVLAIVIVVLAYILYQSITEPYARVERQKELTELTRERMRDVRSALVTYERRNDRFLSTLDSLLMWVKQDSFMIAKADSIFGSDLDVDSLIYSPRTGKKFEYVLNDTSRVSTYLLKDPDSIDSIGTMMGDVTLLNAASWE